jgi:predicted enzyme related to lactoylglutathione lyase
MSPSIHYLEIVTAEADRVIDAYTRVFGLSFGKPDSDLGQARVATREDGTLIGVRKPLADHEAPIMRTYLAVDDIEKAVEKAKAAGAMIAYGPMQQGAAGTFAIAIQGEVQHGFWQK